tara:strand:+ start:5508 stop:6893 length:1386 start_codon:yes stop_codon:yes gene_type:complete
VRSLIHKLPKPILFGLLGAMGCVVAWAVGEPVLSVIKPEKQADSDEFDEEVAPVLVFNNEMQQRLEREGAKSGDVQISLMWNNMNDIDLHCIDPNGQEIFYNNKKSRSGGELDVDMNANEPYSRQPVENIFWPPDGAPQGRYSVFVEHYDIHDEVNTTEYTVAVKWGGEVKEFTGSLNHQQQRTIFEFEMKDAPQRTLTEVKSQRPTVSLTATAIIGVWTSLFAVAASFMLVLGQNFLMRRPLSSKQIGLVVSGGLAAGLVSGIVSQYIFSYVVGLLGDKAADLPWLVKSGQVVGWGLLGALLGIGMSFFIPNLARIKAGLAGLIGGGVGGVAFLIALAVIADSAGRLIGTVILGFTIGLVVALVERLAREAALIVHWDPNEQTVVNLGTEPVILGSGKEVHLYIPKERGFPDIAALVTFKDGRVEMENRMTNTTHTLYGGNKLEIGTLMIEIQTDAQAPA